MFCTNSIANFLPVSNSSGLDLAKNNKISCTEQVRLQYADKKGYTVVLRKSKKSLRQFSIPCAAITERIEPMIARFGKWNDVWISQNTFCKKGSRKVEDVYQFCAVYSDLDCHKLGLAPELVRIELEQEHFRRTIPEPNLVTFSGRGLQLVWFIEPESLYSFPVWQAVQDYIFKMLEEYGADPQSTDAARILRVADTYNQKNHAQVEVYHQASYVHSLTEIIKEYILPTLPEPPEKPKKTTYKPRKKTNTDEEKIKYLFKPYTLHWARMQDMQKLVELRKDTLSEKGRGWGRETLLFLHRYYACLFRKDPELALKETMELNRLFKKPLSRGEVEHATRSAETMFLNRDNPEYIKKAKELGYKDAGYNYSSARLIKLLEITPEEQKHLTITISKEEKERRRTEKRRASGMLERQTYLDQCAAAVKDNVTKAKKLKEQGMSQRAIAKELGVSQYTVCQYLKK